MSVEFNLGLFLGLMWLLTVGVLIGQRLEQSGGQLSSATFHIIGALVSIVLLSLMF